MEYKYFNHFCVETVEVIHHRHHLGRLQIYKKDKKVPQLHTTVNLNKKIKKKKRYSQLRRNKNETWKDIAEDFLE